MAMSLAATAVLLLAAAVPAASQRSFSLAYVPNPDTDSPNCSIPRDNRAKNSIFARWKEVETVTGADAIFSLVDYPSADEPFWSDNFEPALDETRVLGRFAARSNVLRSEQTTVHGSTKVIVYAARVVWFEDFAGTGVVLEGGAAMGELTDVYISVFRTAEGERFVLTAGEHMVDVALPSVRQIERTFEDTTEFAATAINDVLPNHRSAVSLTNAYDTAAPSGVQRVSAAIAREAVENTRNLRTATEDQNLTNCRTQARRWSSPFELEGIFEFTLQNSNCRVEGMGLNRRFATGGEGSDIPQLPTLSTEEGVVLVLVPAVVETILVIFVTLKVWGRSLKVSARDVRSQRMDLRWETITTFAVLLIESVEAAFLAKVSIDQANWPRCRYADFGTPCVDSFPASPLGKVALSNVMRGIECYVDVRSDWPWAAVALTCVGIILIALGCQFYLLRKVTVKERSGVYGAHDVETLSADSGTRSTVPL